MSTAWCQMDGPDISPSYPVVLSSLLSLHLLVIVCPFQQSLIVSFQISLPGLSDWLHMRNVYRVVLFPVTWYKNLAHSNDGGAYSTAHFTSFLHVSQLYSEVLSILSNCPPKGNHEWLFLHHRLAQRREKHTRLHLFCRHLAKPEQYLYFSKDSKCIINILAICVLYKLRNSYITQRRQIFQKSSLNNPFGKSNKLLKQAFWIDGENQTCH